MESGSSRTPCPSSVTGEGSIIFSLQESERYTMAASPGTVRNLLMLRRSCVVLVVGVLSVSSFASHAAAEEATPAAWTPELMLKVRRVAGVRPSPDGRRVAYTVAEAVMTDDRSEFVSQIWLANADGSEAKQMTF